LPEKYQK